MTKDLEKLIQTHFPTPAGAPFTNKYQIQEDPGLVIFHLYNKPVMVRIEFANECTEQELVDELKGHFPGLVKEMGFGL